MTTLSLVFQFFNLQVYSKRSFTDYIFNRTESQTYYWRDPGCPQGKGPFNTIQSCVKDYQDFVTALETPTVTTNELGNEVKTHHVIRVDFRSRQRVPDA